MRWGRNTLPHFRVSVICQAEYKALYKEKPLPSWWGWKFFGNNTWAECWCRECWCLIISLLAVRSFSCSAPKKELFVDRKEEEKRNSVAFCVCLFAATCWCFLKNPGGICTSFGFGFYVFVDHNMLWSSCNFHHSVGHCCKFYLRPLVGYTWKVRIDLSRNEWLRHSAETWIPRVKYKSQCNPGLERRWWRWISMFESFVHQNCFDTKNSHGIWKTLGDPGQVQRCWSFAAFAEHFSSQDFGNIFLALPKYRTHVVTGIMCCQTSRKTGFRFKPSPWNLSGFASPTSWCCAGAAWRRLRPLRCWRGAPVPLRRRCWAPSRPCLRHRWSTSRWLKVDVGTVYMVYSV